MSYQYIVRIVRPLPLPRVDDCPEGVFYPAIIDIDIRKAKTEISKAWELFYHDFGHPPQVTILSREVAAAFRYGRLSRSFSHYSGKMLESPRLSMYEVRCF